jgi:hypothetical protein
LSLLLKSALAYVIVNVQENNVGLKLSETRELLVYADDVNLMNTKIDCIKKSRDTSKQVCLEVNTERTVHVAISSPECRSKSRYKQVNCPFKCGRAQIFVNDSNKSKI